MAQVNNAMKALKELIHSSTDMKLSYNGDEYTLTGRNSDDYKALRAEVLEAKQNEIEAEEADE